MRAWYTGDRKKFLIAFVVIWVVQMAAAFYFCVQKQGFHEDEYYTYYSTARTDGFFVEDGQWMEREIYRNEFVVLPEGRFQYGLIKLVQSWDVHPPMYYWVFHTVASFVPNVFSKWIGLSVNLVFHGINIILMTLMSYLIAGRRGGLPLFATLFWGLSTAVMSGVVFIRMYEMLTMFVLLCGILHIHAVQRNEAKLSVFRCLLPMAAVTYLGFLTQYYYFIFLFYLAVAFCVWLIWRDRNICNCFRYGISQGIAFVLACLTYPSCLGQMFRGQRGAQATENFFDWSNTVERIDFFYDLMNRYAFGHMLSVLLLLILIFAVTVRSGGKRKRAVKSGIVQADKAGQAERPIREQHIIGLGAEFWMLTFTVAGYFLTVSKTALLLGETSNRYQLPIYGIAVLLVFVAISRLWRVMIADCMKNNRYVKYFKYTEMTAAALCLVVILLGHWKEGVVFLYPEDREQTAFAEECATQGTPAIYLYQMGEEWCIWDVANELLAYQEVYFASAQNNGVIVDNRIRSADSLVVYFAKGANEEMQVKKILQSNIKLMKYRLKFEENYCSVYYFY